MTSALSSTCVVVRGSSVAFLQILVHILLVSDLKACLWAGHGVEAVPLSLHQFIESYFCHYASVCIVEPIYQSGMFVCDFPDVTAEMQQSVSFIVSVLGVCWPAGN